METALLAELAAVSLLVLGMLHEHPFPAHPGVETSGGDRADNEARQVIGHALEGHADEAADDQSPRVPELPESLATEISHEVRQREPREEDDCREDRDANE